MKISSLLAACTIALIGLVGGLLIWHFFHTGSGVEWAQRVSGVTFPQGTKELAYYDNGEWFYVGVAQLLPQSSASFAENYHFKQDNDFLILEHLAKALPLKFRKVPLREKALSLQGKSLHIRWSFVLNRDLGILWFAILYPDPGGIDP